MQKQGWIYPGEPACSAPSTYQNNPIDVLKPEYYSLNHKGVLVQTTVASDGCNGYSPAMLKDVKSHSKEQYTTVSGDLAGMQALFATSGRQSAAISTLIQFAVNHGITGVELDFEQYGAWTIADYNHFLGFVTLLGTVLHSHQKKLLICAPAIESQTSQNWYKFNYQDFNNLPIDGLCIMAYDYQWDYGAGTPVAPNDWVKRVIAWAKTHISNPSHIVLGMPSYGYHGTTGGYDIKIDTAVQSATYPGYATAVRDPNSYEMHWEQGGISYFFQDQKGLDMKLALIASQGITQVSVWHLGGNPWFTP